MKKNGKNGLYTRTQTVIDRRIWEMRTEIFKNVTPFTVLFCFVLFFGGIFSVLFSQCLLNENNH